MRHQTCTATISKIFSSHCTTRPPQATKSREMSYHIQTINFRGGLRHSPKGWVQKFKV